MSVSRKTVLKCLGFGAGILPIGGVCSATYRRQDIIENRRVARRLGIPLVFEDLTRAPKLPDSQNAAPLLRKLHQLWESTPKISRNVWEQSASNFFKNPENPEYLSEFKKKLDIFPDIINPSNDILKFNHCDFQYDWSLGLKLTYPELQFTRMYAQFFAARALLATTPEKAFEDIAIVAHLGKLLQETPILVAATASESIRSMAQTCYITAVKYFGSSPVARKTLESFGPIANPEFFSRCDVVMGTMVARMLCDGDPDVKDVFDTPLEDRWTEDKEQWEERYLVFWCEVFSILKMPKADLLQKESLLKAMMQKWLHDRVHASQNFVALCLGPTFIEKISTLPLRSATSQVLQEETLRLMEAKAKNGAFPEKPDLPLDPYSGKPLGYRREGAGCILWSVGPDRKNDDGVARSDDDKQLDLVVRL